MQLQLNILPPLNWLDFCFKALLSSCNVMYLPWWLLSAIESPAKSKLRTWNYLLPWKLHLYYKTDGDLSEIMRTSTSKFSSLGLGMPLASLMMTCNQSLPACYCRHKLEKRCHYEDRVIQIEHGCFTPLVFSTSGGMGPSASVFFKRLASLLSTKRNAHYGSVMSWIRCKIYSLLPYPSIIKFWLCTRRVPNCPSCLTVYLISESIIFTIVFSLKKNDDVLLWNMPKLCMCSLYC